MGFGLNFAGGDVTYSRGALYFLRQPFNHLGVRLSTELTEIVGFTFLLANGGVTRSTAVEDEFGRLRSATASR